ncbi:hypothetical protein Dtox_4224 [Desulfofarcimen acetoxidans DSM 771]|uniref:Uncharacterized protein n=1 Tax=Desulfofarcimen acetoxidans (strain ATCC 49208 / DSM 771 / KCTC 5769 / VKM B-1644 / 5575) TaxID=485916 RepID=C8VZE6_DESAS|nr:hypothetical protein [Desulfofarcimen acetoxidans]ACV64891.1 hypothetical protein Dtox_4224 [Desulfofarcimen acetoxidans DSM 771]
MNKDVLEKRKLMSTIVAKDFADLNGSVMRTVNTVFKSRWFKLSDLLLAFPERQDETIETLNYLEKAGYLEARDIESKVKMEIQYSEFNETEVILTAKGIRLVKYIETDDAVDV